MKIPTQLLFSLLLIPTFLFFSCEKDIPTDLTTTVFIPKPISVEATNKAFLFDKELNIYIEKKNEQLKSTGQYLANQISQSIGVTCSSNISDEIPIKSIVLSLSDELDLGAEGYELAITKKQIMVFANQPTGIFYGAQTLLQLLNAENKKSEKGQTVLPTGIIRDAPSYAHRGSMLDVCRHFFSVKDVKRYIDFLAAFKMNVLHLHLTEDQGWRIEIKKWPKLTEIGGSTEVGGGEGGFFTQEQYKEIVQYAADRHIMIIPEIDMPGHTNAALASYAELNCDGKATKLYTGTEVGFSSLCTDKEITYQFIDDVIGELAAMTPGPYIHIGGDETHVTKEKDFIKFIDRVKGIVESHGKKMIGWDETAQAGLDKNAMVQLWASPKYAKMAAEKNAQIIMSPATKAYLDMQYDSTTKLGLHWAAYIEVDSAYIWEPSEFIKGINKENIIGVEAPLWTETITNMDELEYMVFPRLLGIAEIGWTPAELRNWEEYKIRLAKFGNRLEAMEIDYYKSKLVEWE